MRREAAAGKTRRALKCFAPDVLYRRAGPYHAAPEYTPQLALAGGRKRGPE